MSSENFPSNSHGSSRRISPTSPVGERKVQKPTGRPRKSRRVWAYRGIALLLFPALFFVTVELGLRMGGAGYPPQFLLPLAEKPALLVDNYRFAWRFFPRSLARSPQPILTPERQPLGTLRVVVFGGSAAMGDPEPAYGLSRLLEVMLSSRFQGRRIEVINAAVTAVNSHVVLPIARDCRRLDADAWVVYLGNNEVHGPFGPGTVFGGEGAPLWLIRAGLALKSTKIGQLLAAGMGPSQEAAPASWGGMEMFLDHQIRHDDPRLDRVYANFRRNLEDILDAAADSRTPVAVSTVVTNLKDSPPFVSLHRDGLSDQDLDDWQSFFAAGCAAQARGETTAALEAFEQAAKIDAEYAELEYRQGQCLRQLGKFSSARDLFIRARDHDALRFRADSTINEIIRATAESGGAADLRLVDASRELAETLAGGIVGDELLHEHVHLNFTGNYRLALAVAKQLAEILAPGARNAGDAPAGWPSEDACADQLGLTTYHRLLINREMRERFREAPFSGQIDRERRDERLQADAVRLTAALTPAAARSAIDRFRQLIDERPEDWVLRKQFAVLLDSAGDLPGASEQFQRITAQLPHHAESFFRLGALWNRQQQWPDAERALRKALELRPDFARAANSLGICLSHEEKFEESFAQFRRALQLQPTFAEAYVNWGLVLANQGETSAAQERYQKALEVNPDYVSAHLQLGRSYVAASDPLAALPHYEAVVRLKPQDAVAHLNLGLLYLELDGREAAAREQFERTLELDPGNRFARQALKQLPGRSP